MKPIVFVVMAKEPRAGKTKTRLVPPLTYQQAADLYEALLRDTIAILSELGWADLAVAFSPPAAEGYFQKVASPGARILPIEGADIGECLNQTLDQLLVMGYRKVIAVNADGPSLPVPYLHQAAAELDNCDIVLGEGHDGGYYLVGMKTLHREIFEGVSWSTPSVLAQTLEKVGKTGLRVILTPVWYDVDRVEDLKRLHNELDDLPPDNLRHTRDFLNQLPPGV